MGVTWGLTASQLRAIAARETTLTFEETLDCAARKCASARNPVKHDRNDAAKKQRVFRIIRGSKE